MKDILNKYCIKSEHCENEWLIFHFIFKYNEKYEYAILTDKDSCFIHEFTSLLKLKMFCESLSDD